MTSFRKRSDIVSWGRIVRADHEFARPTFRDELPGLLSEELLSSGRSLAVGLRRSYGDSCLNPDGALIDMTGLDRLIKFDENSGVLTAEAGASLSAVIEFAIPRGYFLPVSPGTRFVTLGGAVANDVHGKNHHGAGTFGRWVKEIGLLRSDGTHHVLGPDDMSGLFAATIGGMGLTGVITHVSLQLKPISSSELETETIGFEALSDFFELAEESETGFEYTVAWVDCLARDEALGRGLFIRANHVSDGPLKLDRRRGAVSVPVEAPSFSLNRFSVRAFNKLYHALGRRKRGKARVSYSPFFYPLDAISDWNRIYGKRGMYQHQSVVPPGVAKDATKQMLGAISDAGEGSFLAVLKTFGGVSSRGLMSFPMEGTTLALDFPNRGAKTLALLDRLDDIVREAAGRHNPAKYSRIPPDLFRRGYPELDEFSRHADPGFSSAFWRRMQQ